MVFVRIKKVIELRALSNMIKMTELRKNINEVAVLINWL